MPTYEYTCKRCGQTIEAFQSFSEKPLRTHKECGGDLQKVFHARGVVFKGSGFYSTDSRSSPKTTTSKSDSKSKSDSNGGTSKSDESTKSASTSTSGSNPSSD